MTAPPVPAPVAEVFAGYGEPVRTRLLEIREMIFAVAAESSGVGPLTETLKWGQPAYLTRTTGSGTTVRLGTAKSAPDGCAVLFHCQTTLIETFRAHFAGDFAFEGNRALIVPVTRPLPREPLRLCLKEALTYHRRTDAARPA